MEKKHEQALAELKTIAGRLDDKMDIIMRLVREKDVDQSKDAQNAKADAESAEAKAVLAKAAKKKTPAKKSAAKKNSRG